MDESRYTDMTITINFTLSGLKETALVKIASANSMAPEEYAESIVTSFLESQARGYYQDKFNALTTLQMIELFGDMT